MFMLTNTFNRNSVRQIEFFTQFGLAIVFTTTSVMKHRILHVMQDADLPDKVKESGVFHLGISDHSIVYVCLNVSLPRNKPTVESRNLKNYYVNYFNDHLSLLLNNSLWNQNNPNQLWDQFRNIFNHVSDIYAPVKTRKVRSTYSPWLTTNIRCEIFKKESRQNQFQKTSLGL